MVAWRGRGGVRGRSLRWPPRRGVNVPCGGACWLRRGVLWRHGGHAVTYAASCNRRPGCVAGLPRRGCRRCQAVRPPRRQRYATVTKVTAAQRPQPRFLPRCRRRRTRRPPSPGPIPGGAPSPGSPTRRGRRAGGPIASGRPKPPPPYRSTARARWLSRRSNAPGIAVRAHWEAGSRSD